MTPGATGPARAAGDGTLAECLVAALADLAVIETTQVATIESKTGSGYSYKYADIADVVKLTRPALAKQGIVALTPIQGYDDGLACLVLLVHKSGEQMELGPFPFPAGHDAQSTGSAVTYHRRYALIAALGLAADDDDGKAASPSSARSKRQGPPICPVCDKPALEDITKRGAGYVHKACLESDTPASEEPF